GTFSSTFLVVFFAVVFFSGAFFAAAGAVFFLVILRWIYGEKKTGDDPEPSGSSPVFGLLSNPASCGTFISGIRCQRRHRAPVVHHLPLGTHHGIGCDHGVFTLVVILAGYREFHWITRRTLQSDPGRIATFH